MKRMAGSAWLIVMVSAMVDTMLLGDLLLPLAGWVVLQAGLAAAYAVGSVRRRPALDRVGLERVGLERAGHLGVMALLTAALGAPGVMPAMAAGSSGMPGMEDTSAAAGSLLVAAALAAAAAYAVYAGAQALRCHGLALAEHVGCALSVLGMAAMVTLM